MANKVDTRNGCYDSLHQKRDVFHAVKGGTDAIRAKSETYLPKYPAEEPKDYTERLSQSTIDGIVSGGCDTLSGAVFYGDIDVSGVNTAIQPLLENIDQKGNAFNVFARQSFDAAFDGSAVILIDAPKAKAEIKSLEDEKVMGIRPYWRLYYANDVINWRYRVNPVSMATELELIVFYEPVEEVDPTNKFAVVKVEKYRAYYFDGMNVTWELWRKVDKQQTDGSHFILEDYGFLEGRTAIPVAIVGALEEEPRLLVESRLEVKAYQKESSFDVIEYLSVPTFFTKGYEGEDKLALGASVHVKLPLEGDVGFAQIDAAGHVSLKETIASIKEYVKSRLNELTTAAMGNAAEKTATEVSIADRDKQARLIVWAEQFKDALELALGYTAEAMGLGKDQGGEIVLQTKWEVAKQEAEENKMRQSELEQANIAATAAKAAVSN
jgi:hypothetical protein